MGHWAEWSTTSASFGSVPVCDREVLSTIIGRTLVGRRGNRSLEGTLYHHLLSQTEREGLRPRVNRDSLEVLLDILLYLILRGL